MDYTGNSNKDKEPKKPKKNVERIITTEVLVQRKTLGQKFKDLFIEADLKSVMRFVLYDVVLPAARNTIVDASSRGIERMMYGEQAVRRRNSFGGPGPRVTYNNPVTRGYGSGGLQPPPAARQLNSMRASQNNLIFTTRLEAEQVVERLNDIVDAYEVVSLADLKELVGLKTEFTDNKYGWIYVGDIRIHETREGFMLDLPPADPIQ